MRGSSGGMAFPSSPKVKPPNLERDGGFGAESLAAVRRVSQARGMPAHLSYHVGGELSTPDRLRVRAERDDG